MLPAPHRGSDLPWFYLDGNGVQPGDPDKASEILIELAESDQPPQHLYLGQDAYNRAAKKLKAMTISLEEWKTVSISADFYPQ